MKARSSLRFPRLRLFALTLSDLALVSLSALGIQDGRPLLSAPSGLLLVLSAAFLLLLCREWFSPSYIDMDSETVSVKWNNWRLSGRKLRAELTSGRPRSLELAVGEPVFSVDPVGPLHLGAMVLARPLLSPFLPRHLSRLYYLDSRKLAELVGVPGAGAAVTFPVCFFGRRRVKNVLEKTVG